MNAPDSNSLTFPVKLKRIVDAPETDYLIYWDEDGLSFHIVDENQLARDIIPNYFKHNNISSFIRQLNMYGFHKINRIENGLAVIGSGKDDSQWSHPLFIREKPDLLQNITRKVTNGPFNYAVSSKKPNSNGNEIVAYDSVKNDIAHLAKAVQHLKRRDEETSEKLRTLQEENHQLYSVLMYLREEHDKQSKLIDILIKFFSLYANNPQESRLKSKRLFAIELPKSNSSISSLTEQPPRKYLVTSQNDSLPGSLSDDMPNSFKGKKVIKIPPKSIMNHNQICRITSDPKSSPIYSISLPKLKNNVIIPSRAITALRSNTSKPTFIIPNSKPKQQQITIANSDNNSGNVKKPTAKTVTVSSIDNSQDDKVYDTQHLNFPPNELSLSPSVDILSNPDQFQTDFNIEDFLDLSTKDNNSHLSNGINFRDHDLFQQNSFLTSKSSNNEHNVSNMISDISANVSSVGKSLDEIKRCFSAENGYPSNNTSTQLPGSDTNFDLELDGVVDGINVNDDDELNTLWKSIYSGSPDYSTTVSDPGRIQGHELIPFNNTVQQHCNEWQEPVYNYQDNFTIDDLLQTPEVHREESSLSLLDNNDLFSDSSKL